MSPLMQKINVVMNWYSVTWKCFYLMGVLGVLEPFLTTMFKCLRYFMHKEKFQYVLFLKSLIFLLFSLYIECVYKKYKWEFYSGSLSYLGSVDWIFMEFVLSVRRFFRESFRIFHIVLTFSNTELCRKIL